MEMTDLSIGKLLSCGRKYAEYFPLNRGTQDEAELEMQLIGLAKEEDGSVKLLLLEPFEKNESDAFPTRTRNVTTKRQQLTQIARRLEEERYQNNPGNYFIKKVQIADNIYDITESRIGILEAEDVFFLRGCLQQGWEPQTMTDWVFDLLGLCEITLDTDWEELVGAITSWEKVSITLGQYSKRIPVKKKMTLNITGQSEDVKPKKYVLPQEDYPIWIDRVYLYDPWEGEEEQFSDPELLECFSQEMLEELKEQNERQMERICPKGKYLPLIEYESEDNRQLEFFDAHYLSQPINCSGKTVDFLVRPDQKRGTMGYPLRGELLQTPVDADCGSICVEVLFYWEAQKEDRIAKF